MEFKELVQMRRSCRSFENTPIPEDQIQAVIDAGRWAPSPLNLQPWEFIIVTEPGVKDRIVEVAEAARQEVIDNGGPDWVSKYKMGYLKDAPVMIVVVADPSKGGLGDFFGQKSGALQAASACIQNMSLAASELGLETLWFTFFRPEKLKSLLGVPDNLDVAAVVPVGKPKAPVKAPPRKAPIIYRQRYGGNP